MKNGRQRANFRGVGMSSPHEYRSKSKRALVPGGERQDVLAARGI
jgi:hypothetical protein